MQMNNRFRMHGDPPFLRDKISRRNCCFNFFFFFILFYSFTDKQFLRNNLEYVSAIRTPQTIFLLNTWIWVSVAWHSGEHKSIHFLNESPDS
jgi:hypothetical protein